MCVRRPDGEAGAEHPFVLHRVGAEVLEDPLIVTAQEAGDTVRIQDGAESVGIVKSDGFSSLGDRLDLVGKRLGIFRKGRLEQAVRVRALQGDAPAIVHDGCLGGPRQKRAEHDPALVAPHQAVDAQDVEGCATEAEEQSFDRAEISHCTSRRSRLEDTAPQRTASVVG